MCVLCVTVARCCNTLANVIVLAAAAPRKCRKRQRGLAEPCSCAAQPDDEGWCAQGSRWVGLCVPVCNVCILHARQQVGGNGSVWMLFFVLFWK